MQMQIYAVAIYCYTNFILKCLPEHSQVNVLKSK